ncbi:MAG: DUF502 domain-containing protein [Candidatus Omnitrophica bacterium]|nr:DUF502 domain-containing protein [Candidatus Omnitrophota bacterium]
MIKKFQRGFFTGLLVILPVFLTFLIFKFVVVQLNGLLLEPFVSILGEYRVRIPEFIIVFLKAIIFVLVMAGVCLLGLATELLVLKRILRFFEDLFARVPLVGRIYTSIKKISEAFLGQAQGRIFRKAILVEYPRKGIYSIGFVTGEPMGELQEKTPQDMISIFLPTTPNPTSGFFLLIKRDEVIDVEMTVEEALRVVISAGAVSAGPLRL